MTQVAEREQQKQDTSRGSERSAEDGESGGKGTALRTAAAVAAAGAAAVATRKVLSKRSGSNKVTETLKSGISEPLPAAGAMLRSAAEGGWDAARDALLPVAEDAAGAAGKYLAHNAPEVVRERIVPRFISSFNEASS
jgi:hypothetical protein